MTDPLAIEALTVRVPGGRAAIIDGVSLRIGPAEILGIVGESGSGKTTLIHAIMGLIRPDSGRITLDGHALPDLSQRSFRSLRRRVALMFQNPAGSFNPRFRVSAILGEARRGLGTARDAAQLLSLVGLDRALLQAYPHAMSGGQARRVALARALAAEPAVILADEPTAGLDVSTQGEMINLLLDLRDTAGTSLAFITHNLPVVRRCSDRIAVMYLGRIVETGPTGAVCAAPLHPYTKALLDAEPIPDPTRRRTAPPIQGEIPSLFARPAGCEFHPRCPRVLARCKSEAPALASVSGHSRAVRCHNPLGAA